MGEVMKDVFSAIPRFPAFFISMTGVEKKVLKCDYSKS